MGYILQGTANATCLASGKHSKEPILQIPQRNERLLLFFLIKKEIGHRQHQHAFQFNAHHFSWKIHI